MTDTPGAHAHRHLVAGAAIVLGFGMAAALAPVVAPYEPLAPDLANNYAGPSGRHLLGTDDLGRDTLSRILFGARISLGISVLAVVLALGAGTTLGLVAAYYAGWVDRVIMRGMDTLLALPSILLAIAIVAMLGQGLVNTVAAVAIFAVPTFARLTRGSALATLELDFIASCRAIGAGDARILLRHVLPGVLSPLVVQATLMFGTAIVLASGLSFLGLGVQPPQPEWGAMLSRGRDLIRVAPVSAVAPGACLTLVVLGFSLLGDGLRDLLDPRMRR